MRSSSAEVGSAAPPPPRVYLQLHHKRPREGFLEEAPGSQYVRLQWDTTEMGAPPAALQRALAATQTKYIFRRLPDPASGGAAQQSKDTSSEVHAGAAVNGRASRCAHVERVTRAGKCVLIECGDGASANASTSVRNTTMEAASTLYVLDSHATAAAAMTDAFGEFAITDDDDADTCAVDGLFKRERGNTDDIADVFLAPVRRRTEAQGDSAALSCVQNADVAGDSAWGAVEEDATGTTWAMLRAYDAQLCVESAGEATADLYCYPDHRKDDEYDSNAEDFSGNDYPDDADDGGGDDDDGYDGRGYGDASSLSSTGRHDRRGRGTAAYGMFCEENYSERSLSSGWSSDDG